MSEPAPDPGTQHSNTRPSNGRRAGLTALLLVATLGAGAASRWATGTPIAPPTRIAGAGAQVAVEAGLDRSAVLRGGDGRVRLELVVRAHPSAVETPRVPTDLVVVLDRSGSMAGAPIATATAAVHELITGLTDEDRFALVSYASDARLEIALEAARPGARERWQRAVGPVTAGGGTHLSGGLDRAHSLLEGAGRAGRAARVVVLSDGLANQGDYSLQGLRSRAARALAGEYVLSSVGIGDAFDETVMSALADAGTGNFYYLPDVARLSGVFSDEFAAARETVARALAVHVETGPGVRVVGAAGHPLHREESSGAVRFHPGDLFAGQERRVWLDLEVPTWETGALALGALHLEFTTRDGERHRLDLDPLPELACVGNDDDYYASFDDARYRRANLRQSLGALKESVARKVSQGRTEEAVAELDAYRTRNAAEQLRAFGSVLDEEARVVDELRDLVAAPAAAEPEVQNRLGKSLLESGRDDQRAGAKKR